MRPLVRCMQCLTCGPGECGKDREEAGAKAAKDWNRRAEPENRVLPFSYQYTCRKCGWKTGEQAERFRYCPMCGEPKKEV